jgi:hypothetical protein
MEVVKTTKEKQLPITLLIQAHGSSKDFEHYLFFGDAPITSRKLFKRLKGVLSEEYPISIFTISCHGNVAAQAAQEELPKGSTFVALSRGGDPVYMSDVQRFIDQTMRVSASWHNIENILYSYLTPLEYKFTPSITYVPNEPLDLGGVLQNQGDKKSSEEQKERVVQRLQDFIPAPEIRRIIGTIESQRQKINDLSSVKYGLTLAVALALRNCEKIDRNH